MTNAEVPVWAREFDIRITVRNIDRVTKYVLQRATYRRHRRTPPDIVEAAHRVRSRVDEEALEQVLEWLARCPYAPPFRVGAAAWDLADPRLSYIIRCQREAMLRLLTAA